MVHAQPIYHLEELSFGELIMKIDEFESTKYDSTVWFYLDAYISKSKKENHNRHLFYAYKEGIYYSQSYEQQLAFADSAIFIATQLQDKNYLATSYLSKGVAYYRNRKLEDALQAFLEAGKMVSKDEHTYLYYKIKFNMALIALNLGNYREALDLLNACVSYYASHLKDSNCRTFYINCLYNLAQVSLKEQDLVEAKKYLTLGKKLCLHYADDLQLMYFELMLGNLYFEEKKYPLAIETIGKELPKLTRSDDFHALVKSYYYTGKSYEHLNDVEKTVYHYLKIDSVFHEKQFLDPEFRPAYEYLISYYEENREVALQLKYIKQLLKVDQINHDLYKVLGYKLYKEYDTQELIKRKDELESKQSRFLIIFYVGLTLLIILLGVLYMIYLKNKKLEKEFQKLWTTKLEVQSVYDEESINEDYLELGIAREVVLEILNRLEKFEKEKRFLDPQIDLKKLAESLKTNTTYLSKIINHYKQVNFSIYLNKLRIYYLIELIKADKKYQNYTLKALAEMSGYTNVRHFSNAFLQITTMRPQFFIKGLNKSNESGIF